MPQATPEPDKAQTFNDRFRRFTLVIWIFLEHTFYIGLFSGGIWILGWFLKLLGLGHRPIPIPFFPQPVELDDALFLMDFVVLVLFYFIAIREIAELYNVRFGFLLLKRTRS
jgi:hypothetical protein